jgi:hypothetical protein
LTYIAVVDIKDFDALAFRDIPDNLGTIPLVILRELCTDVLIDTRLPCIESTGVLLVDAEVCHHFYKTLDLIVDDLEIEASTRDNLGHFDIEVFLLNGLVGFIFLYFCNDIRINICPNLESNDQPQHNVSDAVQIQP